ncbi:MAG: PfkB family carbohydrate kinase [Halolamina sp.]
MPYQRLASRLTEDAVPTVSTLPDGSLDRYCRLSAGALDPIERRRTFARETMTGGRSGFGLEPERVEPGGQSVNTAGQAHALGAEATCYGHLDNPVFADVPFDTVSMGEPAVVNVLDFEDEDLLLVEHSPDIADWELSDLRAVAPLPEVFGVDAVTCSNWVSTPGMADAFHALGERSLPRVPFIFDPGDVLGSDLDSHRELRRAVRALQATFDVIVSVNRRELHALTAALPEPPDPPVDDRDRVTAFREATEVTAVLKHGEREALAATGEGVVAIENPTVEDQRQTGGGDRFAGGLAVGLGADWSWEVALACGNACASHYVATGETATVDALRAWLR